MVDMKSTYSARLCAATDGACSTLISEHLIPLLASEFVMANYPSVRMALSISATFLAHILWISPALSPQFIGPSTVSLRPGPRLLLVSFAASGRVETLCRCVLVTEPAVGGQASATSDIEVSVDLFGVTLGTSLHIMHDIRYDC